MSCILYSKGAYNQLEANSQLARELFSPLSLADFLFELNADAYKVRYGHHEEIDSEVQDAREDVEGDYEFQLKDWNDVSELHNLLTRVRYQCSDIYDKGEESADPDHVARYNVLEAAISDLERRMANPAYKLEQARKRELEREEAAKQKEIDKARIIQELKAKYPWAKQDDGKTSHYARAAKNLKKELTLAFPGVKFSVRSESYSMGNSVDVSWTDGPTAKEVDAIASKYSYGTFDSMTDCAGEDNSAFGAAVEVVLGRARHVSTSRRYSQRFLRDAVIEVCFKYGHEELPIVKTYNGGAAWIDGGDVPYCNGAMHYDTLQQKIMQHAHETATQQ